MRLHILRPLAFPIGLQEQLRLVENALSDNRRGVPPRGV